ncbi:MAG: heterodisulfide reductase-related iron-sulfur binding cluster [Myxococcota bacterium]
MAENISYKPTDGLSYDPAEPRYWEREALDKEITRVFEVCHGCRMCFKYCDSFPSLFSLIDDRHDGDVRKLTAAEIGSVMDACFQCKLCEVQCPYTPRDGHEFQLDFPKLVHRWSAQQAKANGLSLRDRVLGNPNGLAKLARASFGMANVMNKVSLHRWFMEKFLGIHRDKKLPDFASTPFEKWAEKAGLLGREKGGEAVLFPSCFVENNDPQIGRDTLEVMAANQVDVRCEQGFACCGMPAWEHGDLEGLRAGAKQNLDLLEPWVDAGARVMVLQPSCAMLMRREYPELVAPEDRERAAKVAAAVVDPGEHLWSIRKEERYNTAYKSGPAGGTVAYHAPCHLRAQAVGFRGRDLMRKVPGVDKIDAAMECCGHDGTAAMKVEGYDQSVRVGRKAFDEMKASEAKVWVSDCALACLQFEQHAGVAPMHPMTFLARAHRTGGFSDLQLEAAPEPRALPGAAGPEEAG